MTVSIKEAPVPSDALGPQWLDNGHVLFRGASLGTKVDDLPLYVWDIDQGTVTKDPRFKAGRPSYVNAKTGSYVIGRTLFEKGKEIQIPDGIWINPISGRPAATQPPPWIVNGHTSTSRVPLLEEHGYIDRGIDGKDQIEDFPLLYYRSGSTQPVPLGLKSKQVDPRAQYHPFLDAYLLQGQRGPLWAPPLWLLYPNATVEQIFSPDGKAWAKESWSWVELTKRGVVFGKITYRGDQVKDSGVYLWENQKLTQVANAVLTYPAVSPDGCKLAAIERRLKQQVPQDKQFRVQIIDVCGGPNVH